MSAVGDNQGDQAASDHNERELRNLENDESSKFPKIISFRDLCRCGDEVWIEHEGQLYRLRRTKQGKLLLTK